MNTYIAEALKLPVSERVQLVAEIWDSIAVSPEKIDLKPETLDLLRKRLNAHIREPDSGSPWPEVKSRILKSSHQ